MRPDDLTIRARTFPGLLLEEYSYRPGPPSDYPPHVHDSYQFGIALARAGEYRFRGETRPVPTGAVIVIHPGERHSVRETEPRLDSTAYLMLYADVDLVRGIVEESTGQQAAPFFADPVADADIVRMYRSLFAADTTIDVVRESRLLAMITTLTARHADARRVAREPARARHELIRVREYLLDSPTAPIALQQLADLAGMSRFHLLRQFTREFGVPPHTYHLQARLDRAKRLLAQGEDGGRVALKTGFYDQSHFGRHFRRLVGVSPGRYRATAGRAITSYPAAQSHR